MNISWLKLNVNILDDNKIKIIRKYPAGNDLFVLWIGLLCLAMKSDKTGYVYIADGIPYTDTDLANEFDLEVKTVQMGLELFRKFKMIDFTVGNVIEIINFNKHQEIDKIELKREQNRLRQKEYRDRQRNALLTYDSRISNPTDKIRSDKSRSDQIRSDKNREDEDIEKEKKRSADKSAVISVIDYINNNCNKSYTYKNKAYNRVILARLKDGYSIEQLKNIVDIKLNDPFFQSNNQYYNPETLYRQSNIEKYLNQDVKINQGVKYDYTTQPERF